MPTELIIAGGVVGLIGGTIGIISGAWNLVDRIAAARTRARERKANDYDIDQSVF